MRKFNFLTIVSILFILPHSALSMPSGSIEGIVVDIKTKNPLYNVNVFIKGKNIGDATDSRGRYHIIGVPAGKYEIVASMIGYGSSYWNQDKTSDR